MSSLASSKSKKVWRNFQTLNSMLSNIGIRDETKEEWINKNELLEINRTKKMKIRILLIINKVQTTHYF